MSCGQSNVIVPLKTDDSIAENVKKIFDTSYEFDRPFPERKNKKVIRLMNDELGGQTMKVCLIKRKIIQLFN